MKYYSNLSDPFISRFFNIIRWTGLFVMLPIIIYGVAQLYHLVPLSPLFTPEILFVLLCGFLIVGLWQFAAKDYSPFTTAVRLTLFHTLGLLHIVLISGLVSPLPIFWFLLLAISEIFFGWIGFIISSLFLLVGMSLIMMVVGLDSPSSLIFSLATTAVVIICGIFNVQMRRITQDEHRLLEESRKERNAEREQLKTLINSIGLAIVSTDSKGDIEISNAAFLSLLDTNERLEKKNIDTVCSFFDNSGKPIDFHDFIKEQKEAFRDDIWLRYEDGEQSRLGITMTPLHTHTGADQIIGYIFILEDITRQKSLEEERDEFISVVSHELRTPITIAEGTISNAQLLLKRQASPQVVSDAFKEAHDQIVYLAGMVNDLGTLSRAERGIGDELEDINLDDLASELYHEYREMANEKGLAFDLDIKGKLGNIFTSRLYLGEILQNFLTNAVKYTPEGTITLSIEKHGKKFCFAVKDTGIGMSKSDQKHIFEKFFRSEDYRTRQTSGTGLGLYVVAKLADKLHTEVELKSRLNHGSEFSFTLPEKSEDYRELNV